MIPAHARRRHTAVLEREAKLKRYLETSPINRWETGDASFGVTSGLMFGRYAHGRLPGDLVKLLYQRAARPSSSGAARAGASVFLKRPSFLRTGIAPRIRWGNQHCLTACLARIITSATDRHARACVQPGLSMAVTR